MNRIFRVLWSKALGIWVVTSEITTPRASRGGHARKSRRLHAAATLGAAVCVGFFFPSPSHAQSWTGATSTDWTVGSNWSTGTAPAGGTVTLNTNAPNPAVLGVAGPVNATIGLLQMGMAAGTSALIVQNGSTLSSSTTAGTNYIGNVAGTTASLTITGPGSSWSTGAATFLGQATGSTGTLTITDRATANLARLTLGQNGTNSNGMLNVTVGGVLNSDASTLFALGTNSTAEVSGAGSQWNVNGALAIGTGRPGNPGVATLNVSGGGVVAATGNITIGGPSLSTSGNGALAVTGPGSQLSTSGTLSVGLYGTGTLTVSDQATVTAGAVKMTANAVAQATLDVTDGGVLSLQSLSGGPGTAQANFDGSTLRATASSTAFIDGFAGTSLNIAAGGLTLDTDGFADTVASPLTGVGALTKTGTGTLVMTADSSYSGGTTISAGTLQLGNGGTSGSIAGDVNNAGALVFDRSDVYRFDGTLSGSGTVTQIGTGTTVLTRATYSGATTVTAGTLKAAIDNAFSASSAVTVQGGGSLDLDGHSQHVAALANAGTVHFGATPGTTMTVQGDYVGQGGTVLLNTVLGDDHSTTDRLVVGGSTSGTTMLRVSNVGGTGAQTTAGIKLVDVQGASNGVFALQGDYVFQGQQAVVAGAYAYRLYKGSTAADGDWYLRSALLNPPTDPTDPTEPTDPVQPLYQPGVPLYEAYAGMLQRLVKLDTLATRTGHRQWSTTQDAGDMKPGEGLWVRVEGGSQTLKPETTTSGTDYDVSTSKAEAGIDAMLSESGAGKLVGGATLQAGHDHADVRSVYGRGRVKTDGYGAGVSLTWYGNRGFYVDGQVTGMHFDTDLRSTTLGQSLKDGNKCHGYAAGIELGQRFGLGDDLSVVPQAQLSYGSARFDGFSDVFGTRVSQKEGKALTARGGLAIDYQRTWQGAGGSVASHVYTIANVYKTTKDGARVEVAGTELTTRNENTWGALGLGATLDWGDGRYSVYGEVQASTGLSHFRDSHGENGNVGFRMRW